jgi:hypothetical protein
MPLKKRKSKHKDHFTQLLADEISDQFRDVRDSLGIGGESPPSLYECRALAALEAQKGGRSAQDISRLLAHTDEATRAVYLRDHEIIDGKKITGRFKVEVG